MGNFEEFYPKKLKNLKTVNKFLNSYVLLKLKPGDITKLKRHTKSNKIDTVIKSPSTKQIPELERLTVEFYQTLKEGLLPTLLKLFYKIEMEGTQQN